MQQEYIWQQIHFKKAKMIPHYNVRKKINCHVLGIILSCRNMVIVSLTVSAIKTRCFFDVSLKKLLNLFFETNKWHSGCVSIHGCQRLENQTMWKLELIWKKRKKSSWFLHFVNLTSSRAWWICHITAGCVHSYPLHVHIQVCCEYGPPHIMANCWHRWHHLNINYNNIEGFFSIWIFGYNPYKQTSETNRFRFWNCARFSPYIVLYCATNVVAADFSILRVSSNSSDICYSDSVVMR